MERLSVISSEYWKNSAKSFKNVRMLAFAAVICALRIAVKALRIPLAPGLYLTMDCYINSIGALVCGPLLGLLIGAVSDTIGAILFPTGAYFFPFIVVEMMSTFIFALFFWKRQITASRAIAAKFSVNFICNILLNSLLMKWYYFYLGTEQAYNIINTARIVKNLILFPFEATIICLLLNALIPALKKLRFLDSEQAGIPITKKNVILIILLFIVAIGLVLFYIFYLKDFIKDNNFKFL